MSVCLRSCLGAVLPCPGTLNHIRASVPQCPRLQNGDIEGAGIPSSLCVMIGLVADSCQGLDRGGRWGGGMSGATASQVSICPQAGKPRGRMA